MVIMVTMGDGVSDLQPGCLWKTKNKQAGGQPRHAVQLTTVVQSNFSSAFPLWCCGKAACGTFLLCFFVWCSGKAEYGALFMYFYSFLSGVVAWQSVVGHEATYNRTAIMWSRSVPWQSRVWLDTKLTTTERVSELWNRCCGMTECGRTRSYLKQNSEFVKQMQISAVA